MFFSNFNLFMVGAYDILSETSVNPLQMITTILLTVSVILLYFLSGCHLNETLEELLNSLWNVIEQSENKRDRVNESMLIIYIKDHPIHISCIGMRVTKRNIVLLLCAFIASRVAAKLVDMLY